VSESTVNSLLEAVRRSGFSHGVVRVDGVHLEFGQFSARPPAAAPEPVREAVVTAGGPGTVELAVGSGDVVEQGSELGCVRVHRKTVPLVAPESGRVASVHVPSGAFASYGDAVLSIRSDR
jgi:biotin carboxyl carrier protein